MDPGQYMWQQSGVTGLTGALKMKLEEGSGQNKVLEEHPAAVPKPWKSSRRNRKTHGIACGQAVCWESILNILSMQGALTENVLHACRREQVWKIPSTSDHGVPRNTEGFGDPGCGCCSPPEHLTSKTQAVIIPHPPSLKQSKFWLHGREAILFHFFYVAFCTLQALRRHWSGLKGLQWCGWVIIILIIVPREYPSQNEDSRLQVTSLVHPGKPDLGLGRGTGKERTCGKAEGLKYLSRYSSLRIILQSSDFIFPLIMTHTK